MSFMKTVVENNLPIWNKCMDTPFIQELWTGKLPENKFKEYMIQDSIYLKHYARVYGQAIYCSKRLKDIQIFYSILNFVTDAESAVRIRYLKKYGVTDDDIESIKPLPENQNYIDFLLSQAKGQNVCEMLIAVLPCMMSYSYIFRRLAKSPRGKQSKYRDFIEDYADDKYFENCNFWAEFADEKCRKLSGENLKQLSGIFKKASVLELEFWNMAYREQG